MLNLIDQVLVLDFSEPVRAEDAQLERLEIQANKGAAPGDTQVPLGTEKVRRVNRSLHVLLTLESATELFINVTDETSTIAFACGNRS